MKAPTYDPISNYGKLGSTNTGSSFNVGPLLPRQVLGLSGNQIRDTANATGIIQAFAGGTPPDGWLLCNGQSVSRNSYPQLFAVIGTQWGGSSSSFTIPDLRGRALVGQDVTQTEFDTVGKVGGDKNLQSHVHQQTSGASLNVSAGVNTGLAYDHFGSTFPSNMSTAAAGTGTAGNLQPYAVVNYIIKT